MGGVFSVFCVHMQKKHTKNRDVDLHTLVPHLEAMLRNDHLVYTLEGPPVIRGHKAYNIIDSDDS